MPELPNQMDIFDVLGQETEGEPTAARALKVLSSAKELGWTENPHCSLVLRLTREDAIPFYARWDLSFDPESGKKSWRFQGARVQNGQPLAFGDIQAYLEDPRVIEPEMPDELCEAAEHDNPEQTEAAALEALRPVLKQIPEYDWGAVLSG